jgi:ABC-type nitrate/sulfonate/bicarbonate transport system ATPase subunit
MEASPIAIRFSDVRKHFKDRDVEALGGIDLEVFRGEFVCLIGPSGSGKSTLLEMVETSDEGVLPKGKSRLTENPRTPERKRIWNRFPGVDALSLVSCP